MNNQDERMKELMRRSPVAFRRFLSMITALKEYDRLGKSSDTYDLGLQRQLIDFMFVARLDPDARSALVAYLDGDNEVFSTWYFAQTNPGVDRATTEIRAETSPWYLAIARDLVPSVDQHMRRHPEWQAARDKPDVRTLDRLMLEDDPRWIDAMARQRRDNQRRRKLNNESPD